MEIVMECPMAKGLPHAVFKFDDPVWVKDRTCSYCGSLHPDDFMQAVRDGKQLTSTSKNYKVNLDNNKKFYFGHLSKDQMQEFTQLYKDNLIKFSGESSFYCLPFFMVQS